MKKYIIIFLFAIIGFYLFEKYEFHIKAKSYLKENNISTKGLDCKHFKSEYLSGDSGYCTLKANNIDEILEKLNLNHLPCNNCSSTHYTDIRTLSVCDEFFKRKEVNPEIIYRDKPYFLNLAYYSKEIGYICFCYQRRGFEPS